MKPSSNLYRTALHNETLPDGNLTARQRALVDAVRHCSALSDFAAAPKEALTRINGPASPGHGPNSTGLRGC